MTNNEHKHGIYIKHDLWQQARDKAGKVKMSYVIRALLIKWLNGEIEITMEDMAR